MTGKALLAEFKAKKEGMYQFKLYPQLWKSPALARYYSGRKWDVHEFTNPAPSLPDISGIYMFVVAPYCAGLKDHSYIFYVGKAKNIRKRYNEYLIEKEGGGENPRGEIMILLNDFEGYLHFHFTAVPEVELKTAEDLLKDNLTPVSNTQLALIGKLTSV